MNLCLPEISGNIDKKQSLKKSTSPELALDLENYMCELSEKYFYAGWILDLERILWKEISSDTNNEKSLGKLTYSEAFILKKFSEEAEGWFYWPDHVKDGPVFVTKNEWKQIYEQSRID